MKGSDFSIINHKKPTKSGWTIICFIKTCGLFKQLESMFSQIEYKLQIKC